MNAETVWTPVTSFYTFFLRHREPWPFESVSVVFKDFYGSFTTITPFGLCEWVTVIHVVTDFFFLHSTRS